MPMTSRTMDLALRLPPTCTRTFRGISLLGLVEGFGLAAGLVMQLLVARALSPADYGRFAVLSVIELVVLILMSSGLPQALRYLVGRNPSNFPEAVRWIVRMQLPLSFGMAATLSLGATVLGRLLGDRTIVSSLSILAIAVSIRCGLLEPSLLLLNGAHRCAAQAFVGATYHVLRVACVAAFLSLTKDLSGTITGLAVAALLTSALAALLVWGLRQQSADVPDIDFAVWVRKWVKLAFGYELLSFLLVASNLWVVKALVSDPTVVGLYAACFMTARASSALSRAAVDGTFAPLTAAFAHGRIESARVLVAGVTRAIVLLLIPTLAFILPRGEAFIRLLYGPKYAGSGTLFGVLFAGACGAAVLSFFGGVLGTAGALRARLHAVITLNFAGIVSSVAFVHLAGPVGAAWALLLTGVAGTAITALLVRSRVGSFLPWSSIVRALAATTPMIAFSFWGKLGIGSALALGLPSYGCILILLQEWTEGERRSLFQRLRAALCLRLGERSQQPSSA